MSVVVCFLMSAVELSAFTVNIMKLDVTLLEVSKNVAVRFLFCMILPDLKQSLPCIPAWISITT